MALAMGLEPGTAETYSDIMTWLYGGCLTHEKANRVLEGSQVEPSLNQLALAQNENLVHVNGKGG